MTRAGWVDDFNKVASYPLLTNSKRKSITSEKNMSQDAFMQFAEAERQFSGGYTVEDTRASRVVAGAAYQGDSSINTIQGVTLKTRKGASKKSNEYLDYLASISVRGEDYLENLEEARSRQEKVFNEVNTEYGKLHQAYRAYIQGKEGAKKVDIDKLEGLRSDRLAARKSLASITRNRDYFNLMKSTGRLNFRVFGLSENVNPRLLKQYIETFQNADISAQSIKASDVNFKAGAVHTRKSGFYKGEQYDISSRLRRGKIGSSKGHNFLYADGGEGHIQRVVYNIPSSIMEVTFAKAGVYGNVCVFFEVAQSVAYQICRAIETNETLIRHSSRRNKGKSDLQVEERHLAGILFWDYIRVRTTQSGVRVPFDYVASPVEVENKSSITERMTPNEHGIVENSPVQSVANSSNVYTIKYKGRDINIPVISGYTEGDDVSRLEIYDSGILDDIRGEGYEVARAIKTAYDDGGGRINVKYVIQQLEKLIQGGYISEDDMDNLVIDDTYNQ